MTACQSADGMGALCSTCERPSMENDQSPRVVASGKALTAPTARTPGSARNSPSSCVKNARTLVLVAYLACGGATRNVSAAVG